MMGSEPQTWLGNIQRVTKSTPLICGATWAMCRCDKPVAGHGSTHRCAVEACRNVWSDRDPYCNRCGLPHSGECLRGDR